MLNETGLIWAGAYNNMFTWPWNFGQFEAYSLNVALYLMDLKDLSAEERRSPVVVSRIMAEMVNRMIYKEHNATRNIAQLPYFWDFGWLFICGWICAS